jgi:hypothetical protein
MERYHHGKPRHKLKDNIKEDLHEMQYDAAVQGLV